MATPDIAQLRNVSSDVIRAAEARSSTVYNVLGKEEEPESKFSVIFNRALENIDTTNAYLSDAENEEIKWALGQTENTHDLAVALQKAQTTLQYTIAVRDRALSAYREITQMQI
ncbi:MAG: flagellar hook-basal body complex protein FliE [Butyrivibrio sp.]|nr:flagellar hook-basal body complex protein FliE [Butyrivibrio sp.]